MFEQAAARYLSLWTFVGRLDGQRHAKLFGLGCNVAPGLVLTAAHVYAGSTHPTASINGCLWDCSVVAEWADKDIAMLRAERKLQSLNDVNPAPTYPQLATDFPKIGMQLGCMAWLELSEPNGEMRGRTYFGQGHVAYFERGARGEILFALQGTTIERGFSGGPVFSADGHLYGVLVQAVQHAPKLNERVVQISSMALMSPVGRIAAEISRLIESDVPIPELQ